MGLSGCAAIKHRVDWKEHYREEDYANRLLIRAKPFLRDVPLKSLRASWEGEGPLERAQHYYSVWRYANDPDSRYRIVILEQLVPKPGAPRQVVVWFGRGRDYWEDTHPGVRRMRSEIVTPELRARFPDSTPRSSRRRSSAPRRLDSSL